MQRITLKYSYIYKNLNKKYSANSKLWYARKMQRRCTSPHGAMVAGPRRRLQRQPFLPHFSCCPACHCHCFFVVFYIQRTVLYYFIFRLFHFIVFLICLLLHYLCRADVVICCCCLSTKLVLIYFVLRLICVRHCAAGLGLGSTKIPLLLSLRGSRTVELAERGIADGNGKLFVRTRQIQMPVNVA